MSIKMKHFKIEEFACPCCNKRSMDDEFLAAIDTCRDMAGIPFVITSGFRCKKHNAEIGGKPNSAHLRGLAADIKCLDSRSREIIIRNIFRVCHLHKYPVRIGIAKNFIHWDIDKNLPNNVIWLY